MSKESKEHKEQSHNSTSLDSLSRNSRGGIQISPHELHSAFEFFDLDNKGYITIADLKKRLGVFYQNLSLREYKFLMNNKSELTEQELYQLLEQNELTNYDPVAEAFKIYDPQDTGFIDLNVFKEILSNLGFNDINEQDIQSLIDISDMDGDGKVSLSDFRKMLPTQNHSHHHHHNRSTSHSKEHFNNTNTSTNSKSSAKKGSQTHR